MEKEKLEKNRLMVQKETSYFLGINKEDERVYLRLPSFDCGWYWGCGYISTYRGSFNSENNYSMHTHFKGYIIGQQEEYDFDKGHYVKKEYTHHLNEVLKETVLTDKESWVLSELISSMEKLKDSAEFFNRGGGNMTDNPLKEELKDEEMYKKINGRLLPKIFIEIDKLLKGNKEGCLTEDYFNKMVVYE